MVLFTRLLQSKTGKRKRLVEFMEKLTIKEPLFSSMVHLQEVADDEDCLNLAKAEWLAPWDGACAQYYSFAELFRLAVEEATDMVNVLYSFVLGEASYDELINKIGNRSLKTGMDTGG